jgi:hypothetical protein
LRSVSGSASQYKVGLYSVIRIENGNLDPHERVPGDLGPALLQHGHVELVGLVHLAHRLLVLTSQPVTENNYCRALNLKQGDTKKNSAEDPDLTDIVLNQLASWIRIWIFLITDPDAVPDPDSYYSSKI